VTTINPETGSIWSRARLTAAFNRVADAADWKAPISARIIIDSAEEKARIREAIIFFTATVPTFGSPWRPVDQPDECVWYHVRAIGYRMGPAGP